VIPSSRSPHPLSSYAFSHPVTPGAKKVPTVSRDSTTMERVENPPGPPSRHRRLSPSRPAQTHHRSRSIFRRSTGRRRWRRSRLQKPFSLYLSFSPSPVCRDESRISHSPLAKREFRLALVLSLSFLFLASGIRQSHRAHWWLRTTLPRNQHRVTSLRGGKGT
jgi:hypothetical protein